MEHEGDGDTNCDWHTWNGPKFLKRGQKEMKIEEQIETIQTPARIQEESGISEETCFHLDFTEIPTANTGVKNSQGVK